MARGPAANGEVWTRSRRQRRVLALRERRALRKRTRAMARGLALGAVLAGAGPAAAATFTVTHTNELRARQPSPGPDRLQRAAGADDIVFAVTPPATISLFEPPAGAGRGPGVH